MGMTYVQKLLAQVCGKPRVETGEVLELPVNLAMSHENAALVINQFNEIFRDTGREPRVWDPDRIAIIFDHRVPAESSKTATNQRKIRDFVAAQGISRFHDIRGDMGGICHQILPENGYVRPGQVVVGTDSHTTTHGALGAFAFGIGATEMAAVWALGSVFNVEVPGTIKVEVNGALPRGVYAKDLILHLVGELTAEGANFRIIEFHGGAIRNLPTSGRLVLCNMSVEAGATAGVVPPDAETRRYLREEAGVEDSLHVFAPDAYAVLAKEAAQLVLVRAAGRPVLRVVVQQLVEGFDVLGPGRKDQRLRHRDRRQAVDFHLRETGIGSADVGCQNSHVAFFLCVCLAGRVADSTPIPAAGVTPAPADRHRSRPAPPARG